MSKVKKFFKYFFSIVGIILIILVMIIVFINSSTYIIKIEHWTNAEQTEKELLTRIEAEDMINDSIIIPASNIYAPITFLTDENNFNTYSKQGVVKYPESSFSENKESLSLFGPSAGLFWKEGHYKYAFTNLNSVDNEDPVFVKHNDKIYEYSVVLKEKIRPKNFNPNESKEDSDLILATDWPAGIGLYKLVIYARSENSVDEY